MAHELQPTGPSGAFQRTYVDILSGRYPELVARLKAHRVTREDSALMTRLASESNEMNLAISLHLAKYAPEGTKPKQYADNKIGAAIEHWFHKDVPNRDFLVDGILAFMVDTPKVFKQYSDLLRSWEETDTILARVFRRGKGDSGKGSSGSGQGKLGGSGPEGGPQGFDPL